MFRRSNNPKHKPATPETAKDTARIPEDPRLDKALKAIGGFAEALTVQLEKGAVGRGEHITHELKRPISNNYGIFVKSWDYTEGCEPLTELETAGAGVVGLIAIKRDGSMTRLMLGRTPAGAYEDLETGVDGTADVPGEYTMLLTNSDREFDNTPEIHYFEKSDLADVRFEVGTESAITLNDGQSLDIGRIDFVQALI